MSHTNGSATETERLPKGTVLIAGGGPVGLLVAKVLSHYGVKSVLLERNKTTTRWPKMDLTNPRSMEIFRRLGISEGLRHLGVAPNIDQPVLISTGLHADEPLSKWDLPGVDNFRKHIQTHNDGTQPLEPWQRVSQVVFERWLKDMCDKDPLVDVRFGWKVVDVQETYDGVRTTVTHTDTQNTVLIDSDYLAGCDGASSKTRQSMEMPIDGGPVPTCVLLVHFKSSDLTRIRKQGQFWHIFLLGPPGEFKGAIIAQDEVDTWTTHFFLPLDTDTDAITSEEAVYQVLGGIHGRYPIKIDEILVRSVWRPNIAIARKWTSPNSRVLIAGDAAHQNIPTGGYGMNMGIADAYDLGWKLAAVINGYAGRALIDSYEEERRPVVLRSVEHSGVHFNVHIQVKDLLADSGPCCIIQDTDEGRALRLRVHNHYQEHDGENKDVGIEMGYRYKSPVIIVDEKEEEPTWVASRYIPSTWPGARPPHVFLSDGTPIFDHFGKHWTLLSFCTNTCEQETFTQAAKKLSIPLTNTCLTGESLAQELYERKFILLRPDQHVAWRGDSAPSTEEAEQILSTIVGNVKTMASNGFGSQTATTPLKAFTSTVGLTTQVDGFNMNRMGEFQR